MFAAELPQPTLYSPAWDRLTSTLQSFGRSVGPLSAIIDAAMATGGTLTPEVQNAYQQWLRAADRLKLRAADIIEKSPQLQTVIETAGTGFSGFGRVGELEAYFAEVTSNVKRVVDLLKEPLPYTEYPSGALLGFGDLDQAAQVAGWAARFAGPLWEGLVTLLRTPTVAAAGAAAVAVQGVDGVLNGESQSYYDAVANLNKLCTEKKLTAEQCNALKPEQPADWKTAVVVGGVALGALAIWLNRRKTALAGLGKYSKKRYKRNWRTS